MKLKVVRVFGFGPKVVEIIGIELDRLNDGKGGTLIKSLRLKS